MEEMAMPSESNRINVLFDAKENDKLTPALILEFKNRKDILDKQDSDGNSLLMLAAREGFIEYVRALLVTEATFDARNNDGVTALMQAAAFGHIDCLKALLATNAQIDVRDNNFGYTPLAAAAYNGQVSCVKLLIDAKANVHATDHEEKTAIYLAVESRQVECLMELMIAGALPGNSDIDNPQAILKLIQSYNQFDPIVVLALTAFCQQQKNASGATIHLDEAELKQAEEYLEKLKQFNQLHKRNIYKSIDQGTGEITTVLVNAIEQYIVPSEIKFADKNLRFFAPKQIDSILQQEQQIEKALSSACKLESKMNL